MMQADPTPSRPNAFQLAAAWLPLLFCGTVLLAWYENDAYVHSVLRLTSWKLSSLDSFLVFATILAKSLVLLAIPVALALVLTKRFGTGVFWLLAGVVPLIILGYIATDMRIKVITGQSLEYYLRRVVSQNALQFGGDGKRFVLPLLLPLVAGAVGLAGVLAVRRRIEQWIARTPGPLATWLSAGIASISLLTVVAVLGIRPTVNQPVALQRLHQQFPSHAVFFHPSAVAPTGKTVFQTDVRDAFQDLARSILQSSTRGNVLDEGELPVNAARPHVVLLILESFRPESIRKETMPKLSERSARGFVAKRHLSGSNCSPQGAFALLYGQYATHYDAVLNNGHGPVLCDRWKASGYQTLFAASCIFDYRRMDEMLSEQTFDAVTTIPCPREEWPQADRDVLLVISDRLRDAGNHVDSSHVANRQQTSLTPTPVLAVGYLNSTHYDYQYPPEYEQIEFEAEATESFAIAASDQHGLPEGISRPTLLARYHRSLRFMDDALDHFLSEIDLANTIVVITGDHGESLYEDGVLSHGSRLSVIQTQTPFVMLGAGVPHETRSSISSHVDLIPTLWRLCGGEAISRPGLHGHSLLVTSNTQADLKDQADLKNQAALESPVGLLVHEFPDSWDLMAIRGDDRLMVNQSRTDARLSVLGFSGEDGLINSQIQQPSSQVEQWVRAFHQFTR